MDVCPACGYSAGLTVTEVCALTGNARQTVINWVKRGLLPGTIVDRRFPGTRYLIPVPDLEAHLGRRISEVAIKKVRRRLVRRKKAA